MKSNICKNLLMLLGFALYFIGRLAIFPCADGQKHSFYHMTRPAFLDATDFRMLWNWFVAFILMIGIMLLMHKPNKIWGELGLADKRFCQSIGIGFLFTLPMFIVNAICGELDFTWTAIGISLMAGVCEEVYFRGYFFGQLFRNCRWGFIPASLITSLLFGLLHLYQGHDITSSLLAVLVTGLGGILYSWMYVEWNYRLWIPISLHSFMDVAWMILPVGEEGYGAAGNIATNVGRAVTIILAIGATIYFKRKRGEKCFNFKMI